MTTAKTDEQWWDQQHVRHESPSSRTTKLMLGNLSGNDDTDAIAAGKDRRLAITTGMIVGLSSVKSITNFIPGKVGDA